MESILVHLKTTLDLLASTIEAKKKRKAELKDFVAEDARLNKEIGSLKKEHRIVKARLDWLIGYFREANSGQFPDSIYPLFALDTVRSVRFIGYQELQNHERMAMYEVDYGSYQTTLLEKTLQQRGIPYPPPPPVGEHHAAEAH
jgi:hypothetical protein